jgi:hypothetical protein
MNFELKLDMYNAEQEAVWLNDFIREHDVEGLETEVKRSEPEAGTMDGGSLLPILEGVASGALTRYDVSQWINSREAGRKKIEKRCRYNCSPCPPSTAGRARRR